MGLGKFRLSLESFTRRDKSGPLRKMPGTDVAVRATLPIALVVCWYFLTLGQEDDVRIATPPSVATAFGELWASGDLLLGTWVSLQHIFISFALAAVSGGAVGMLMGFFNTANYWLGPVVHSLRPIAPYAWIPMAILWFGISDAAAIFVITYAAFFPMVVNTMEGVRQVDRTMVDAARVLGASRWMILRRVVFPGALPGIMVGLRLAMGLAWIAVVAAELATGSAGGQGASGGLGQMMFVFYAYEINLDYIVVCIIMVAVMALITDRIMQEVNRRITPWQSDET